MGRENICIYKFSKLNFPEKMENTTRKKIVWRFIKWDGTMSLSWSEQQLESRTHSPAANTNTHFPPTPFSKVLSQWLLLFSFLFSLLSFLFKGSLAATALRQKMYSFKWLRLEIEAWIMMLPFIIALINHTTVLQFRIKKASFPLWCEF